MTPDRHPTTGRWLAHDCETDCQTDCARLCTGPDNEHDTTEEAFSE